MKKSETNFENLFGSGLSGFGTACMNKSQCGFEWPGLWNRNIDKFYLSLLTESNHNQAQSNPDPAKPSTFTQIGNDHPEINTNVPVIIRNNCRIVTMPKMDPATRSPRIFEFIDMIRWNKSPKLISFSQNFVIVIEFLDQKNYYNCYYKKKKPPTKTDVSGWFSSRGSKIRTCDLLLPKQA